MKNFLLGTLIFASTVAQASSPELTAEFKSLVTKSKLGAVTEQTYCYGKDGVTLGYQTEKLQRIASVTKVLSSLLASETMDLHRTFKTKIYIGKDSLHIEGGRDPYFEEDKFLLLLQALNDLGYTSFKKVTFTKDFLFYDIALGEYEKITPEKTKVRLQFYLSGNNPTAVRATWQSIRKFAEEEGISLQVKSPMVTATSVSISDINPLINENPAVFTHQSKPLHNLMKTMNVQSKNLVAENLYEAGSKIKSMTALLTEKGINAASFKIYNGSGLPIISGKSRLDNLAACSTVLKVINLLSESVKKHNLTLPDIMAVNGGKDLGSFRERFLDYPELHESVISKTGTLKHTSSLAGILLINGNIPFAVLNHTTNSSAARKFQDRFVSRMFDHLGVPTPVEYTKISIFPWNDSDFLISAR
jgi:hypothetical protein